MQQHPTAPHNVTTCDQDEYNIHLINYDPDNVRSQIAPFCFVGSAICDREGIDWQTNGFEFCSEAINGEMALPLLRAIQPDVIITDIKMPFMDGLQFSKIVRENMPWVKIIILSGHNEFEYAQRAINVGVTDYLLKPVTVQKRLERPAETDRAIGP